MDKFIIKHRLWFTNIIFFITFFVSSFIIPTIDLYQCVIVFLYFTPFLLLLKPKVIGSNNIMFLSFYTYFTIPFSLNIAFAYYYSMSIFTFTVLVLSTIIIIFIIKYRYHKDKNRKEFLDHSKIALDIVRFIFAVIATLGAIYGKLLDDFSTFTTIMPIFKNLQLEDMRNYFTLTFQIISIPFVFSTTALRIVVDWLLLKR